MSITPNPNSNISNLITFAKKTKTSNCLQEVETDEKIEAEDNVKTELLEENKSDPPHEKDETGIEQPEEENILVETSAEEGEKVTKPEEESEHDEAN